MAVWSAAERFYQLEALAVSASEKKRGRFRAQFMKTAIQDSLCLAVRIEDVSEVFIPRGGS
jgi:hypothetical protein